MIIQNPNRFSGMQDVGFASRKVVQFCSQEVEEHTADPNGNFVERALAEVEKNGNAPTYSLNQQRGKLHISGILNDLFAAGERE